MALLPLKYLKKQPAMTCVCKKLVEQQCEVNERMAASLENNKWEIPDVIF